MQVAWLYNIRGSDVSYSPVVHAFAIVTAESAFLYVDKKKVSPEVSVMTCFVFIFLFLSICRIFRCQYFQEYCANPYHVLCV